MKLIVWPMSWNYNLELIMVTTDIYPLGYLDAFIEKYITQLNVSFVSFDNIYVSDIIFCTSL